MQAGVEKLTAQPVRAVLSEMDLCKLSRSVTLKWLNLDVIFKHACTIISDVTLSHPVVL